jgi:hypothetical protein
MNITSGKRATLGLPPANHDPEPWLDNIGNRFESEAEGDPYPYGVAHDPRPEFDVRDNLILADFRGIVSRDTALESVDLAAFWLKNWVTVTWMESPEQIEHARRVLSKLAAL